LGGHYELWKGGMPLNEMVRIKEDKDWGPTIRVRSLASLKG
jgi:hypothetical protein